MSSRARREASKTNCLSRITFSGLKNEGRVKTTLEHCVSLSSLGSVGDTHLSKGNKLEETHAFLNVVLLALTLLPKPLKR
jgi:hypothetical protein